MDVSAINLFNNKLLIKDAAARSAISKINTHLTLTPAVLNVNPNGSYNNAWIIEKYMTDGAVFDFSSAANSVYNIDGLVINKPNVTFKNCVFTGSLSIEAPDPNNTPLGVKFINCTFKGDIPVTIYKGVGISFNNCRFVNNDISIKITTRGVFPAATWSHIVEDLRVTDCYFENPRIALYSEKGTMTNIPYDYTYIGDLTFTGNTVKVAKECHISLAALDGGIFSNNTLFHYGASSHWRDKTYCLYIREYSAGVNISNNKMFESGFEAINLFNSSHFVITGNIIVQPGQVSPKSGILINYYGTKDAPLIKSYSSITGNVIFTPSKFGIEFQNQDCIISSGNFIVNDGDYSFYYGEMFGYPSLSGISHFAFSSVCANNAIPLSLSFSDKCSNPLVTYTGVGFPGSRSVQLVTVSTSVFPVATQYNLNFAYPTNVTSKILPAFSDGVEITFTAYNENATFVPDEKMRLSGGASYKMPKNSIIRFISMSGILWETGRVSY